MAIHLYVKYTRESIFIPLLTVDALYVLLERKKIHLFIKNFGENQRSVTLSNN
jgi:hypothetical protein